MWAGRSWTRTSLGPPAPRTGSAWVWQSSNPWWPRSADLWCSVRRSTPWPGPRRPRESGPSSGAFVSPDDLQAGGNNPEARLHELADALPDEQEDLLHEAFDGLAKEYSLGVAQTRELQA